MNKSKDTEKTMFVGVEEVMKDWDCSRAKAYQIIRSLSAQLQKEHPGSLSIAGKVNRRFYEEKTLAK